MLGVRCAYRQAIPARLGQVLTRRLLSNICFAALQGNPFGGFEPALQIASQTPCGKLYNPLQPILP
jgi:hypothetical protein